MPKYTSVEVKRYIRGLEGGERAIPILKEAASFSTYADSKLPDCMLGRERLFERLHSVLFQYSQGKSTTEIARTVGYLSDAADVEAAMDYVSQLILNRVNNPRYMFTYRFW